VALARKSFALTRTAIRASASSVAPSRTEIAYTFPPITDARSKTGALSPNP
jgi:hypothetical protein